MKASIRKLRSATKEILSAVARGGTVYITNHGKICAKIIPVKDKKEIKFSDHPACGMWKNRKDLENPSEWVRNLRKSRFDN